MNELASQIACLAGLYLVSWIISEAVQYALWSRTRVLVFRERIFAVRDSLWDDARRLNCLNDPRYLAAREAINGWIRLAPFLNVSSYILFVRETQRRHREGEGCALPSSDNEEMTKCIDVAMHNTSRLVQHYIFCVRFSGWISLKLAALLLPIASWVLKSITRFLEAVVALLEWHRRREGVRAPVKEGVWNRWMSNLSKLPTNKEQVSDEGYFEGAMAYNRILESLFRNHGYGAGW